LNRSKIHGRFEERCWQSRDRQEQNRPPGSKSDEKEAREEVIARGIGIIWRFDAGE
jgi:hypothetical protein